MKTLYAEGPFLTLGLLSFFAVLAICPRNERVRSMAVKQTGSARFHVEPWDQQHNGIEACERAPRGHYPRTPKIIVSAARATRRACARIVGIRSGLQKEMGALQQEHDPSRPTRFRDITLHAAAHCLSPILCTYNMQAWTRRRGDKCTNASVAYLVCVGMNLSEVEGGQVYFARPELH